jgi:putative oxidoreductase
MTTRTASSITSWPPNAIARQVLRWIEWLLRYWLLAIPLRVALAKLFWDAAQAHLANWQATLYLFHTSYRLPFLPPDLAAHMAIVIEVTTPFLLILGFFTRLAALVLLGMTAVIEIFVYPQAWPTHIVWAAMLLVLFARGPGKISLDWLARHYLLGDA